MMETHFGFLQESTRLAWRAGRIEPIGNHDEVVEQTLSSGLVFDGWFYPPLRPVASNTTAPLRPVGFVLPITHVMMLTDDGWSNECANFFITLFGMLKGQRLQREGWQHFYKAPVERKLNNFFAVDSEISKALDKATDFWQTHRDVETRKLAFGALHWHLFAQLYEHEFESFNAQYMALDACHRLATATWNNFKPASTHAERAQDICMQLGVPVPTWAICPSGQKKCELSERRNALVHEAMYGGQPVGFTHPSDQGAMERELPGLVARILLRLLGIDNEYTRSRCAATRATMGFSDVAL